MFFPASPLIHTLVCARHEKSTGVPMALAKHACAPNRKPLIHTLMRAHLRLPCSSPLSPDLFPEQIEILAKFWSIVRSGLLHFTLVSTPANPRPRNHAFPVRPPTHLPMPGFWLLSPLPRPVPGADCDSGKILEHSQQRQVRAAIHSRRQGVRHDRAGVCARARDSGFCYAQKFPSLHGQGVHC